MRHMLKPPHFSQAELFLLWLAVFYAFDTDMANNTKISQGK